MESSELEHVKIGQLVDIDYSNGLFYAKNAEVLGINFNTQALAISYINDYYDNNPWVTNGSPELFKSQFPEFDETKFTKHCVILPFDKIYSLTVNSSNSLVPVLGAILVAGILAKTLSKPNKQRIQVPEITKNNTKIVQTEEIQNENFTSHRNKL